MNMADGQIMKARPYQALLQEIAIEKNTIIHLPTGSGKTFIACELIKKFRSSLLLPWGEGGKRTFFLVNTVPLVMQQKKYIENLCPVGEVGAYSSEQGVDYWNKEKWDQELTKYQVVVMTCQILADMLTHNYIRIDDINLLIFDECHHAVEDHPMRLVMKKFFGCPVDKQPRVLGLTATLLNANVSINKVEETLKDLETTFHATIATVNEMGEVLDYSTNPREIVQYYRMPTLPQGAQEAVQQLMKLQNFVLSIKLPKKDTSDIKLKPMQNVIVNSNQTTKAVKNMIGSMIMYLQEFGTYGGAVGIVAYLVLLEQLKRKCNVKEAELFYITVITSLVEARMTLLKVMENETGYDRIVKHSSEKFLQLLNILKEYNPEMIDKPGVLFKINHARKPLSAIIFTKQRFTAKILYNLLKDVKEANPKEFGFLNHDFIVGFNIDPTKNTREQYFTKKSSQKALLMFGKLELNCLISTSVIEEGVDMPQCLLVVRYDAPLEYRSYIQSKGRSRSKESSFVILVDVTDRERFLASYKKYQNTEQHICNLLIGKSGSRTAPTVDEIQDKFYEEDLIPPYVTPNGNNLSSVSAISLLSRYCMNLPHDNFTSICPMYLEENVTGKNNTSLRLVSVVMPIGCPIKDPIEGNPMPNITLAKRSAALNACIKLHQVGELHYETLLPHKYATVDYESLDIRSCFPNWPQDDGHKSANSLKDGSKKVMRKYPIQFPKYLNAVPKQAFYLHIINMRTVFEKPKDTRNGALYEFLQNKDGYGLITQSPLPKLCNFPAFTTIGEVTITLDINYAVIKLSEKLLNLMKKFHYFLFDQVLAVAKKYLVFEGVQNYLFVVPVKYNNGYEIDWTTMQKHDEIRPVEPPPDSERLHLKVVKDEYVNSVVSPWYRGSILPERYIVSNVLEYMTPNSSFHSDAFYTFEAYYSAKYNLQVIGPKDQPLLEVRNISTRMNCLLPRAVTIKSFTDKQQRLVSASQGDDKPKAFAEVFIPEFCLKYDYPGMLWYKATLIPSIIHRLHMLLVAHELLMEIAADTKYGKPVLSEVEEWQPVSVNYEVSVKSLLAQIEGPNPVNTIDRINVASDGDSSGPKISSMKESLYQLQMKKINREYPWDEMLEPVDIERNLSTVTTMDIACYVEFMSAPVCSRDLPDPPAHRVAAPLAPLAPHVPRSPRAALSPLPVKYNDQLEILKKKPLGRGPELRDVLSALTTIKSHDTFDLEALETLGDSFLKFAGSLYLHHKFPTLNEGQLTNIKCRLISNRNLYYAGRKINLGGRMKVEEFSPRKDFLVPGFFAPAAVEELIVKKKIRPTFLIGMYFSPEEIMSGNLTEDSLNMIFERYSDSDGVAESEPEYGAQNAMQCYVHSQAVADKVVADCVEALVGTYVTSGGMLAGVKILEWLKVLPPQDNFSSYLNKKVPTVITEKKATVEEVEYLLNGYRPDLERILNYKFKDPSILLNAMSHASYIRNRLTSSYERLEFLGDAILDFLVTSHIYENCGNLKPGEITDLRSALVNNVTFAAYTVKLGLHKYLCSELNPTLSKAILNFVEHQQEHNHSILVDVLYMIDEEECQLAEYVDVPKVLSDIFEALVGAMYLDSGGDLQTIWSTVYSIMHREIHMFSISVPKQPVRVLYENIHACPVFHKAVVVDPDIPKVKVQVTFTKNERQHSVFGIGRNKSQAKRAAAKMALKVLYA